MPSHPEPSPEPVRQAAPCSRRIYLFGAGAVALPLAVFLVRAGRDVVVVPPRGPADAGGERRVTVETGARPVGARLQVCALDRLPEVEGLLVIAAKAPANPALAALLRKRARGPVVLLQNGLDIEEPFLAAGFPAVYRAVLYVTAQAGEGSRVVFRSIASCPMGVVRGSSSGLVRCVQRLSTPAFRFHAEPDLPRAVWRKTVINAVFNSICPLLEVDNGIFQRDPAVLSLAQELIAEGVELARSQGVELEATDLLDQVRAISRGGQGVLISTLQDLRQGRATEIESLNLALARRAAASQPPVAVGRIALLGELVRAKGRAAQRSAGD